MPVTCVLGMVLCTERESARWQEHVEFGSKSSFSCFVATVVHTLEQG